MHGKVGGVLGVEPAREAASLPCGFSGGVGHSEDPAGFRHPGRLGRAGSIAVGY